MSDQVETKRAKWRQQIAYGLYDWASSPVLTLQATFIFAVYFTTTVAPENGSVLWSWMNSVTAIVIALISPLLGGLADARASHKSWLAIMSVIGGVATALLWFIEPSAGFIWPALILAGISIIALETTFTFYNALLPSVAAFFYCSNVLCRCTGSDFCVRRYLCREGVWVYSGASDFFRDSH